MLLCLVCGYLALLILSRSGIVKSQLEQRLEQKTGLEWEVESTAWNGLNRLEARGVRIAQPDVIDEERALLSIDRVRITGGQSGVENIEVLSPRGVVTFEMLAALSSGMGGGSIPPATMSHVVQQTPDGDEAAGASKGGESDPAAKPAAPGATTDPPVAKAPVVKDPDVNLIVKGGSFELLKDGSSAGMNARVLGLELDIPIKGANREGAVSWESATISQGDEVLWELPLSQLPVRLRDGDLFLQEIFEIAGAEILLNGRMNPAGTMAFGGLVELRETSISKTSFLGGRFDFAADAIGGQIRIDGAVRVPSTMQIRVSFAGSNVEVEDHQRGQALHFWEMGMQAQANRLGARLHQFRIVGDELSILGNGAVSPDRKVAGAIRLYADWQAAGYVDYHLDGMPSLKSSEPWFGASETPERARRDLRIFGAKDRIWVDAGPGGKNLLLQDLLGEVQAFAETELAEERSSIRSREAEAGKGQTP